MNHKQFANAANVFARAAQGTRHDSGGSPDYSASSISRNGTAFLRFADGQLKGIVTTRGNVYDRIGGERLGGAQ